MKFSGKIGYAVTQEVEVQPGVWKNTSIERDAVGNYTKKYIRYQGSDKVNDNVVLSTVVEVIADPYAMENYNFIKYVIIRGVAWKVESIDITQYPRMVLVLGGEYNAQ